MTKKIRVIARIEIEVEALFSEITKEGGENLPKPLV